MFVLGGWAAGNPDSAKWFTTAMVEPQTGTWPTTHDTLTRYAIVTTGNLDVDYNPQFYAVWWLSDGRVIRDNTPNVTVFGVSATASVDYDSIADIVAAACGGGTGVNAVRIYVRDTANDVNVNGVWALIYNADQVTLEGQGTTNSFGYYDFALNNGTYLGRVNTPPTYLQETAHDTIVVSGVTQDTIEVYSSVNPGLTQIAFAFFDGTGNTIKNVMLGYQLESKYPAYHLRDSSFTLDPSTVFWARTNASGVAYLNVIPNDSIVNPGGKIGETRWRIRASSPAGQLPLLGNDGVSLDVPASSTTLLYPQDFGG
jgi:hypothetical protein